LRFASGFKRAAAAPATRAAGHTKD
jgi:hypothetical protein